MLKDRIYYFEQLFNSLVNTTSLSVKRYYISQMPNEYKDDWQFILECLNGKHKFGYTYKAFSNNVDYDLENLTIKQVLEYLLEPARTKDLTDMYVYMHLAHTFKYAKFLAPIVNRTLKLGIGNSLLEKDATSPMLAKRFEGDILTDRKGYFITEKLDGNRCIAMYDGTKWRFISRNGKEMRVDFDMSSFDKQYIYDGEVLSVEQTINSNKLYNAIKQNIDIDAPLPDLFNSTSGLINQHTKDKKLVYNIFDIVDPGVEYFERRLQLNTYHGEHGDDVRIVPVLKYCKTKDDLYDCVTPLLDKVTGANAEGLMINLANANYVNKRTNSLLKLKKVYTIDMIVTDVEYGRGKYEFDIGTLSCQAITSDGKHIKCQVGTGLSDEQRAYWATNPQAIIGKIIEVAYFSLSQDTNKRGTNEYSLRFPRLKRIRSDKNVTSEY